MTGSDRLSIYPFAGVPLAFSSFLFFLFYLLFFLLIFKLFIDFFFFLFFFFKFSFLFFSFIPTFFISVSSTLYHVSMRVFVQSIVSDFVFEFIA